MTLVAAAIAPHGSLAIPELSGPEEVDLARDTQAAMDELGRRFAAARPESLVILTPHGIHVTGRMAVVLAGAASGFVDEGEGRRVELTSPTDLTLAPEVLDAIGRHGVPVVGVSFGGNATDEAVMPLDWGVLVPLWFLGGRLEPPLPTVIVAPARDLDAETHVAAGNAIGRVLARSTRRVALVASADQAHTHQAAGAYGFDPAAAIFDAWVTEVVRRNDLVALVDLEPALLAAAKPDSWWQLLMLHGALEASGGHRRWQPEILAAEAPTYYGMLTAVFGPVQA